MIRHRLALACLAVAAAVTVSAQQPQQDQVFRFKTGVELINVTATVSDGSGRFVSGLQRTDFRLFEDGQEQQITHFNSERVPVSLGLIIDTSGSMEGEKWTNAKLALNRFLYELLGREDELFLYRFDNQPELVEEWTTDRDRIANGLARIRPRGATSLYDAVAEALPLAQTGRHRKKALVVISDGNDTNSRVTVLQLRQLIRESEVLVYAIGIDSQGITSSNGRYAPPIVAPPDSSPPYLPPTSQPPTQGPRLPVPLPFPIPGPQKPPPAPPKPTPGTPPTTPGSPPSGKSYSQGRDERVNVAALRDITDDSGGRTEIVRTGRDLDPATASVADELSKQYYLGYPSQGKRDGQWHTIRVEARDGRYLVRARRGYVATP
ncbi:MAG TPA: VWA domain-containing protein [Vicinamibacterales bacterium]|jgi:VWFA-related protein